MDFTDGQQVYEGIAKQLADLDIGVLGTTVVHYVRAAVCFKVLFVTGHIIPYSRKIWRGIKFGSLAVRAYMYNV